MSDHILIVDDESNMRLGLKDNLEFEGYQVSEAIDGPDALVKADQIRPSLILLDVMMPNMSGFDVCKKLRKDGNDTPIIMLTAKGEEIDKVLGLEIGADDYIQKPFSVRELLARVKAILRRAHTTSTPVSSSQIGNLTVNFERYEASMQGEEVKLSHKEFEILRFLLTHKNETVERYDLLKGVWGYEEQPTTRTVDNFIAKLRQRIETTPSSPKHIITIHGVGYKLIHNS